MTSRTPGTVRDDSAMEVATTTRGLVGAVSTWSWSRRLIEPVRAITSTCGSAVRRCAATCSTSHAPGRKTRAQVGASVPDASGPSSARGSRAPSSPDPQVFPVPGSLVSVVMAWQV